MRPHDVDQRVAADVVTTPEVGKSMSRVAFARSSLAHVAHRPSVCGFGLLGVRFARDYGPWSFSVLLGQRLHLFVRIDPPFSPFVGRRPQLRVSCPSRYGTAETICLEQVERRDER
jgi:hypothetical protein